MNEKHVSFWAKPRRNALIAALFVLIPGALLGAFYATRDTYLLVGIAVVMTALCAYLLIERQAGIRLSAAEKAEAQKRIRTLEKSRESYENIIVRSPLPIVITNAKGDVEYYNHKFIEVFGYTLDDVRTAEEWWQAAYPDEEYRLLVQRTWEAAIQEATEKETPIATQEWNLTCKDGSVKRVLFDMMPLDEMSVIIMTNITERIQMQAKLAESETRFRTLFEDSAESYLILDNNTFVDCNTATLKMLHANSKEEVLSTHPSELSPKFQPDGQSSAEKANEMIRIALAKGSHRFDWTHRRIDGEDFPVEVLLTPIKVGNKTIIHTAWRDISERKEAAKALKASHERMLVLLDSIPAEIFVSDMKTYEILFANEHMRENYGKELIGSNCYEVFRHEENPCPICPYDQLLDEDGQPVDKYIWEGQNPISKKWYVNYDRAVPWMDGHLVHVQIALDITERKAAEEALKNLNIELDERVLERTKDLHETISAMADREIRMMELKNVITELRTQIKEEGLIPVTHDPLLGPNDEW